LSSKIIGREAANASFATSYGKRKMSLSLCGAAIIETEGNKERLRERRGAFSFPLAPPGASICFVLNILDLSHLQ
jgi:hypothetical protein